MRAFLIFLLFLAFQANAQKSTYKGFPSLVWPKLYSAKFEKATDASGEYEKPIFPDNVKALAGKTVTLPGYIVPFENGMKSSHFILSSLPLNACFFCGVGGPETVVEVYTKEVIPYTDRPMQIKGVLRLNDKDPDKMMYILEQAVVVGEVSL
jgi:hypothetical protein